MSDDFLFIDEGEEVDAIEMGTWKVLIVDDEPEIHTVTKLALSDFVFQDKSLEFVSAYNGEEAKQAFRDHDDIAIVLLDVVMESDDAGLLVAEHIRDVADNHFTRIILRTGQPGQAPERDVIVNYDINDYKSKTELTSQKLFNVVIAALRSYRDIVVIEENRQGLEKIISASANLFSLNSLESFITGIVQQLTSILGGTEDAAYLTSAVAGPKPLNKIEPGEFFVFSGKGEYRDQEGRRLEDVIQGAELATCQRALTEQTVVYEDEHVAAFCQSSFERGSLLYLSGLPHKLTKSDKYLIELFAQNVQIAFDNVLQNREVEEAQQDVINIIHGAFLNQENKGNQVNRLVQYSELLARAYGLSENEIQQLRYIIPVHDVGKFFGEQGSAMLSKSQTLLANTDKRILNMAAIVAGHLAQEGVTSKGQGSSNEPLYVFSQIIDMAKEFEKIANSSQDITQEKINAHFVALSGTRFEPRIVTLLQENVEELQSVMAHTLPTF